MRIFRSNSICSYHMNKATISCKLWYEACAIGKLNYIFRPNLLWHYQMLCLANYLLERTRNQYPKNQFCVEPHIYRILWEIVCYIRHKTDGQKHIQYEFWSSPTKKEHKLCELVINDHIIKVFQLHSNGNNVLQSLRTHIILL